MRYILSLYFLGSFFLFGQNGITVGDIDFSYSQPKEYELGTIRVIGADNFDHQAIKLIAGLRQGQKIILPSNDISKAIRNLWDEGIFANVAIYGYADVTGIHSGFNIFNEVGNAYAGAGNPISPVIIFSGDYNFSIGDRFERNDVDDAVYPRVSHDAYSVYVQYADETHFGTLHQKNGGQVTLADGELTPVATGITFTTAATPMLILDYSLVRNGFYRSGRMLIAHSSSAQNIDDTFIETTDIGVIFSLSYSAGTTSLDYTTTSIGFTGTLTYAIRYLK